MEALTHSSFANERHNKIKCNERMEFLGDAVLSIISANYLFHRFPDMPEGDLSKLRSSLVCTQSLSDFARQISLGNFLFLGKGESNTGNRRHNHICHNGGDDFSECPTDNHTDGHVYHIALHGKSLKFL